MIYMIAAALVAVAPAAPADAHAQNAQHRQAAQQSGQKHDAKMDEKCCCKDMMEKMHSEMKGMHNHQEHSGH